MFAILNIVSRNNILKSAHLAIRKKKKKRRVFPRGLPMRVLLLISFRLRYLRSIPASISLFLSLFLFSSPLFIPFYFSLGFLRLPFSASVFYVRLDSPRITDQRKNETARHDNGRYEGRFSKLNLGRDPAWFSCCSSVAPEINSK